MRIALAASALALALGTAGLVSCTGTGGPPIAPGPEPSTTPVYASDEEALAAAEELYSRYESITNKAGQGGWRDTSRFQEVLSGEALAEETEDAAALADSEYQQVGSSTHDSMSLQQVRELGSGAVEIVVYVCSDVTGVDVVDEHGDSVVSPDRPDRQPLEVSMDNSTRELTITRRDAWSGDTFC